MGMVQIQQFFSQGTVKERNSVVLLVREVLERESEVGE